MWLVELDTVAGHVLAHLSPQESERLLLPGLPRKRRRRALTRGVLRELLGQLIGCGPGEVELADSVAGSPSLAGSSASAATGLYLSVSHSGPLALLALSRAGNVGIDIEARAAVANPDRLVRRVAGAEAARRLGTLGAADRATEALRIWTIREAVLKCRADTEDNRTQPARIESLPLPVPLSLPARAALALERPAARISTYRYRPTRTSEACREGVHPAGAPLSLLACPRR